MPVQENIPTTLEYETPQPGVPWGQLFVRYAPTALWAVALVLYPVFALEVLPGMRRTSGLTDPHINASQWAIAVIAIRAAVALVRRNRSWWSLAYIALYFVLPIVAGVTATWWRST